MFGSCKSISGKYSIFRKCYFPRRKMFSCVWLHFKKFSEKYFLVFGEEEGKDKPRQRRRRCDLDLRRRHSSIVGAVDRKLADRIAHWSTSGAITPSIAIYRDERWRSTSALIRRSHRSLIDERRDRWSVLSDLGSLFSLSLSLSFSGNDLKWKWGCKIISGSKVKISVNRKPFSGKWNLPLLSNTWVWGKMISWNHFPPKQTHP